MTDLLSSMKSTLLLLEQICSHFQRKKPIPITLKINMALPALISHDPCGYLSVKRSHDYPPDVCHVITSAGCGQPVCNDDIYILLNKYGGKKKTNTSHLRLALLPVNDLGRDDFGGGSLGPGAHAFGLGDDHFSDGSGGGDDCRFGPLNCLKALFPLQHTQQAH